MEMYKNRIRAFLMKFIIVLTYIFGWMIAIPVGIQKASKIFYSYFIPDYFRGPIDRADYFFNGRSILCHLGSEYLEFYFIYGCIVGIFISAMYAIITFIWIHKLVKHKIYWFVTNMLWGMICWSAMNTIGIYMIVFLKETDFYFLLLLLLSGCVGLLVHAMQCLILRLPLRKAFRWLLAGILGWALGIAAADLGIFEWSSTLDGAMSILNLCWFLFDWYLQDPFIWIASLTIGIFTGIANCYFSSFIIQEELAK